MSHRGVPPGSEAGSAAGSRNGRPPGRPDSAVLSVRPGNCPGSIASEHVVVGTHRFLVSLRLRPRVRRGRPACQPPRWRQRRPSSSRSSSRSPGREVVQQDLHPHRIEPLVLHEDSRRASSCGPHQRVEGVDEDHVLQELQSLQDRAVKGGGIVDGSGCRRRAAAPAGQARLPVSTRSDDSSRQRQVTGTSPRRKNRRHSRRDQPAAVADGQLVQAVEVHLLQLSVLLAEGELVRRQFEHQRAVREEFEGQGALHRPGPARRGAR